MAKLCQPSDRASTRDTSVGQCLVESLEFGPIHNVTFSCSCGSLHDSRRPERVQCSGRRALTCAPTFTSSPLRLPPYSPPLAAVTPPAARCFPAPPVSWSTSVRAIAMRTARGAVERVSLFILTELRCERIAHPQPLSHGPREFAPRHARQEPVDDQGRGPGDRCGSRPSAGQERGSGWRIPCRCR